MTALWKVVILLVLAGHGIGHMMAPQAAFAPPGALPSKATALGGLTISSPVGHALSVLWLVPLVGFLAATYGLWAGLDWWRPLMALSAAVSIVAVVPWWGAMPFFSYLGALAVDAVVLIALLTPFGDRAATQLFSR